MEIPHATSPRKKNKKGDDETAGKESHEAPPCPLRVPWIYIGYAAYLGVAGKLR